MISKNYKQNKSEVMAIYDNYVAACQKIGKEVDESISKQAEKIKAEIFNLMVLGEAKSGKSTFINAYLGKEVVPMDVRQCTSAIIKIRRGNQFRLEAKTAGGGKTIIDGYDKISEFLAKHAAISDKYRNIPITTINNEILIKYGKLGKGISDRVLENFLEDELKDNIFNIEKEEYKRLIREYIKEKSSSWGKIVTEMDITYPLPEEMQGITIIDSPGVGAGGNVGKIAEDYIDNANAIIFVKSLSGQALESSSFMNFLRTNCREKKKDTLFLVLTGKSNLQGSEFASLKEQAVDMYKNDVDSQRIIFVDSKMQLFLNKCQELGTEEKIDAYFDELDEADNDFPPASKCWLKSKGSISAFNEKMEELSNFSSVQRVLEQFARVANYLQLIDFLENLEKECIRYKGIFSQALTIAKENVDDPDALEDRIIQKKNEIQETYNKMGDGIEEIYKKYTDNIQGEGIIMEEAAKRQADYETQLDYFRTLEKSSITETTFGEMKKMTMDAIDDTVEFRRSLAARVINECNEKLIQYTDDPGKIPAEAYIPNFTETDFEQIDADAKEKSTKIKPIEHGVTFLKTTEKAKEHNLKQHVHLIADNIHDRLDNEIIPALINNVVDYVGECRKTYFEKLSCHKDELEAEYNRLLEQKDDNVRRRAIIDELEIKVNAFSNLAVKVDGLKGELTNYVGKQ